MNRQVSSRPRGQTLIEFAIILPVLLFILVVIFDLGRAVYYYSVLTNVAREGARYGSVESSATNANIQAHALSFAYGVDLLLGDIVVDKAVTTTVTVGGTTRQEINVTVVVDYDYVPITPYVDRLLSGGVINIRTTARMGREY